MSDVRTLFSRSFHYFYGNFFLLATGFISFPILTRILTVNDYGILSYVGCLGTLLVALSKLGLQHSVIRFFPHFKNTNGPYATSVFYSTLYWGPTIFGCFIAALIIAAIVLDFGIFDAEIAGYVAIMAAAIPFRSASSTFFQFLRAEQRAIFFNVVSLLSAYGSLFLGIYLVYFVTGDLWGLYYGGIICRLAIFLYATCYLYAMRNSSLRNISSTFLKKALAYGAPLAGYEFFAQVLEYGDRVLLMHFLGNEAVAIYSVGYSIPLYISQLFGTPLRLAVVPIYMNIWSDRGEQATRQFISQALSYFLLLAIPAVLGTCAIRDDLVLLLASKKYASASTVIPYIIVGTMLYATNCLLACGLFISNRTYFLTLSLLSATILNLIFNVLLIPFLGFAGAAISTLISYSIVLIINAFISFKYLKVEIDFSSFIKGFIAAFFMLLCIRNMDFGYYFTNLIIKIPLGGLIYAALLLIIHGNVRKDVILRLAKFRTH